MSPTSYHAAPSRVKISAYYSDKPANQQGIPVQCGNSVSTGPANTKKRTLVRFNMVRMEGLEPSRA